MIHRITQITRIAFRFRKVEFGNFVQFDEKIPTFGL